MNRLLLTLAVIFISLALGYSLRKWVDAHPSREAEELLKVRRVQAQQFAIFVLIPISAMLSLWGMPHPDPRLLSLPFLGLAAWITGGAAAILFSRSLSLDNRQTGSMYCCGTFTNIGAVGTLVCVLQFGEQSIALTSLYRLLEEIFYFSVAYPVSQWFSTARNSSHFTLRGFRIPPAILAVLAALGTGLALNLLNVSRPAFLGGVASGFMLAGTVCFLFTIGMGLRVSRLTVYFRQSACISAIKFLIVPAVIMALAFCAGLHSAGSSLPIKVVFILSAMPVAMNALIPPSIFDLDLDLANACWIFTTLELVLVLPVLYLLLPLLEASPL